MVALTRKVAAQAGQSTIRTDRLQRVSALLAQLNQKAGQGAAQQVYALADIGEEVRLLENGREVASGSLMIQTSSAMSSPSSVPDLVTRAFTRPTKARRTAGHSVQ